VGEFRLYYNDCAVGWMIQASSPGRDNRFFLSPKHLHWLRGLLSFLFGRYFSGVKVAGDGKLTTHLYQVRRLRMNGAILLFLFYAIMAYTGTELPCNVYVSVLV